MEAKIEALENSMETLETVTRVLNLQYDHIKVLNEKIETLQQTHKEELEKMKTEHELEIEALKSRI